MSTELVVVGAGPAGLSAAIAAARNGVAVTLVDENAKPGGQLFKQIHKFFGSRAHYAGERGIDIGQRLLREVEEVGVRVLLEAVVWGVFAGPTVAFVHGGTNTRLSPACLLLATGATENALAFPGWTLPGVMGAGAVQTMVNVHRVLPGKRVLMVGSGNVGLIVSYQLLQAGAQVAAIIEALPQIGGYGVHASKVRRMGVPILTSTTVLAAQGEQRVEGAVTAAVGPDRAIIPGTEQEWDVDLVCLAVGLTPLAELAWMAGCRFDFVRERGGHLPVHDRNMLTSVDRLYVAGDLAGIEEASTAMEEGKLAGIAVAEALGKIDSTAAEQQKETVRHRLEELRLGPFGDSRPRGNERITWQR